MLSKLSSANWQKNVSTILLSTGRTRNCKKSQWQNGRFFIGSQTEPRRAYRAWFVTKSARSRTLWQQYWVHKCLVRRQRFRFALVEHGTSQLSVLSLFSWIVALDTRSVADENFSAEELTRPAEKPFEKQSLGRKLNLTIFGTLVLCFCLCCLRSWS